MYTRELATHRRRQRHRLPTPRAKSAAVSERKTPCELCAAYPRVGPAAPVASGQPSTGAGHVVAGRAERGGAAAALAAGVHALEAKLRALERVVGLGAGRHI